MLLTNGFGKTINWPYDEAWVLVADGGDEFMTPIGPFATQAEGQAWADIHISPNTDWHFELAENL